MFRVGCRSNRGRNQPTTQNAARRKGQSGVPTSSRKPSRSPFGILLAGNARTAQNVSGRVRIESCEEPSNHAERRRHGRGRTPLPYGRRSGFMRRGWGSTGYNPSVKTFGFASSLYTREPFTFLLTWKVSAQQGSGRERLAAVKREE